jgi:class 3 adenylate cyclase
LIRLFLNRGVGLEAIGNWVESGEMDWHLSLVELPERGQRYSVSEGALQLGLDAELLQRLLVAAGVSEGTFGDRDIETLRMCRTALDVGFPEEAIVQFVRVFADAMRRVAETEAHLFHFYIRHVLQERGVSEHELTQRVREASDAAIPIAEPALLYFHRMALHHAIEDTAVMELKEQADAPQSLEPRGQLEVAIVFVDMAGSTALTEAMGDLKTAELFDRFSTLVRQAVSTWEGHIVKQIGDAFMLTFHDPVHAVSCALEIGRRGMAETRFPALRSGVHWGPVLYREGDYVGATVNLAARLAESAQHHQVLLTSPTRRKVGTLPNVDFVRLPNRRLKGIAEDVELFEARTPELQHATCVVDPVCRMELGTDEIAARLTVAGREHAFCSQECLRRFVAAPDRYATTDT